MKMFKLGAIYLSLFPIFAFSAVRATSMGGGNYSVQLLAGLAPSGFSTEQWNAVIDTMIGKTQAYVCGDFSLK